MKAQHHLLVNFRPCCLESISFMSIDWFNCLIDFDLILFDSRYVLLQIGFPLFDPLTLDLHQNATSCRLKQNQHSLVDHIHNLGINFPFHPSLTCFKFLHLMIKLGDTLFPPVILSTGFTKLPRVPLKDQQGRRNVANALFILRYPLMCSFQASDFIGRRSLVLG